MKKGRGLDEEDEHFWLHLRLERPNIYLVSFLRHLRKINNESMRMLIEKRSIWCQDMTTI